MSCQRRFPHAERSESVFRNPPLVLVAHGSRDPRSAETVLRVADAVRAQARGSDVRTAFLDLSWPSVPEVLGGLHADGHCSAVVVPLLLGSAFHARVDLPALIADATARLPRLDVTVADVLGPDPLLQSAAVDRLTAAGAGPDPDLGVVLAGVGSSHAAANATVARVAARWHARTGFAAVTHAFATCEPSVAAAVARLHARGARRVAVAPWFLAPGLLLDRVAAQARAAARAVGSDSVRLAEPLADHPLVARVVLDRYTTAAALPQAA